MLKYKTPVVKLEPKVYTNFDNYSEIMKEFDKILKKCLEDKKTRIDAANYGYFKLVANDKLSGNKDNIINIFKEKYKNDIQTYDIYYKKYSNYEKIILMYKIVYIGIIIADDKYITFGCDLTKEEINLLINRYWILEIEPIQSSSQRSSRISSQQSSEISSPSSSHLSSEQSSFKEPIQPKNEKEIVYLQNIFNRIYQHNVFTTLLNLKIFFEYIKKAFKMPVSDFKEKYFILKANFNPNEIIELFEEKFLLNVTFKNIFLNDYIIILQIKNIFVSIQGEQRNNIIILHFHKDIKILKDENFTIYNILKDFPLNYYELLLVNNGSKEVFLNFDNFEEEMKAFNKLLNKCIKVKKTNDKTNNYFDYEYFKLIAKDKKTGNIENILNIFSKKYKNLKIEVVDKKYQYSKITFKYKNVYIGIIVINDTFITFGCNLTHDKINLSIYLNWQLEEEEINKPKSISTEGRSKLKQLPKQVVLHTNQGPYFSSNTPLTPNTVFSSREGEGEGGIRLKKSLFDTEIHKDFVDQQYKMDDRSSGDGEVVTYLSNFNKFFKNMYICIKPYKDVKCEFEENFYVLKTEDTETFSAYNIINIFRKVFKQIRVLSLETSQSSYKMLLRYKFLYINIEGKNNVIILHYHIDKSILVKEATIANHILDDILEED